MPSDRPMRTTRQRQVILEELTRLRSHPTADEIYARVRRRLPRISLGTVYRNLDRLSECGLIRRIELAGKPLRFDGCPDEHDHVRCVRCGRIEDVPGRPMAAAVRKIRKKLHYELIGCRLEFLGVCPRCQAKRPVAGTGERR